MAEHRVIIGIGNPGKRYARTRHNVGWDVVEAFADRRGWSFHTKASKVDHASGRVGEATVHLLKPLTYVNLTGNIVPLFANEIQDPARDVMVVCDDLDLPPGSLRVRMRGSSGGHRGLDSLIQAFGTSAFPRMKLGIGRAPGVDPADFVLARSGAAERAAVESTVARAVDALECWIENGVEMTMNRYNRKTAEPPPPEER